jgi:hypothetical protein
MAGFVMKVLDSRQLKLFVIKLVYAFLLSGKILVCSSSSSNKISTHSELKSIYKKNSFPKSVCAIRYLQSLPISRQLLLSFAYNIRLYCG